MNDSRKFRRFVVHGWAFRNIAPDVVAKIKAYLGDGDPEHLNGTTYRILRDKLVQRTEQRWTPDETARRSSSTQWRLTSRDR